MTDGLPPVDLSALPAIPRDADGPVFAAPWQAQAFAMTVRLHEQGVFGWDEWAAALAARIAAGAQTSEPDPGYWHHWLEALEALVTDKGLVSTAELLRRRQVGATSTPQGASDVSERR